jgi:hypothetical protein
VLPVDIRLSAHTNKLRFRPRSYSYLGEVPTLDVFEAPITDWDLVMKWLFDRVVGALNALNPGVALETSYANGGQLSYSYVAPPPTYNYPPPRAYGYAQPPVAYLPPAPVYRAPPPAYAYYPPPPVYYAPPPPVAYTYNQPYGRDYRPPAYYGEVGYRRW